MKSQFTFIFSLILIFSYSCNQSTSNSSSTTTTVVDSTSTQSSAKLSPYVEALGEIAEAKVMIKYSSPRVKGREIWGALEPYDKVWRTGADEATTIESDQELKVEGETLPAGKYALFTIPRASGPWTVIFNKEWDQWGAYNYDPTDDVLRVKVDPVKLDKSVENLTIEVDDSGKLVISWEKIQIPVQLSVS